MRLRQRAEAGSRFVENLKAALPLRPHEPFLLAEAQVMDRAAKPAAATFQRLATLC
jgi:hypothetical protein